MYNMQQQAALYDLFYMSMKGSCGYRRERSLHLMRSMHKASPRAQWGYNEAR
jgi:hypothetical protein